MTEAEFLEKYGDVELEFNHCYKHSMTYTGRGLRVYGLAHYRGSFDRFMTIRKLHEELETFNFSIKEEEQNGQD